VSCCGTVLCLRHYHTSEHASSHPDRAVVLSEDAAEAQSSDFAAMWQATFQAVQVTSLILYRTQSALRKRFQQQHFECHCSKLVALQSYD
jgi:hypothetical protein